MGSVDSPPSLMFSKTWAWRAALKLLSISGRLSRTVFAARAELLDGGMKPTFYENAGHTIQFRHQTESCAHGNSLKNTGPGARKGSLPVNPLERHFPFS